MGYGHGAEELSGKSDPIPALTQPDFLKETKKEYHLRLGVVDTKKRHKSQPRDVRSLVPDPLLFDIVTPTYSGNPSHSVSLSLGLSCLAPCLQPSSSRRQPA